MLLKINIGIYIAISLYVLFHKKNIFNFNIYILIGVYFPLVMYLLGWSELIDMSQSFKFDYVYICFTLLSITFLLFSKRYKPQMICSVNSIAFTRIGKRIGKIINIGFIACYLTENYIFSGYFLPALHHYDDHTGSVPILSYLTNAIICPLVFDYYTYKSTKKVKYILYLCIIFCLPLVTRSSRLMMVISLVQMASIIFFFENYRFRKINTKMIKKIIIVVIPVLVILSLYTNYRMSHYGKYDITYSDSIFFTGPEWAKIIAPFYGYFPLSINNLKLNLMYRQVKHNYIGIYSFAGLFFGVLQVDNVFGIPNNGSIDGRLITNTAATVPTGFWDFYYDYGWLCWIPMFIGFHISLFFLLKAKKENCKLTYRTLYFYFCPLWTFMSFQNIIFSATSITTMILLYLTIRYSFVISTNIDTVRIEHEKTDCK